MSLSRSIVIKAYIAHHLKASDALYEKTEKFLDYAGNWQVLFPQLMKCHKEQSVSVHATVIIRSMCDSYPPTVARLVVHNAFNAHAIQRRRLGEDVQVAELTKTHEII